MTNACACCSSSGRRGSRCSSRQTHEEQVSTSELFLRLNSNFRQIWYFFVNLVHRWFSLGRLHSCWSGLKIAFERITCIVCKGKAHCNDLSDAPNLPWQKNKHRGGDKKFYIYLVDLPFSEALLPVDSFEVGDNFAHLFWSSALVFVSFRWSGQHIFAGTCHTFDVRPMRSNYKAGQWRKPLALRSRGYSPSQQPSSRQGPLGKFHLISLCRRTWRNIMCQVHHGMWLLHLDPFFRTQHLQMWTKKSSGRVFSFRSCPFHTTSCAKYFFSNLTS